MSATVEILAAGIHQCTTETSGKDEVANAVAFALQESAAPDVVATQLRHLVGDHGAMYYSLLPEHVFNVQDAQGQTWTLKLRMTNDLTDGVTTSSG
jgi:hypothetical protein